MMGQGPTQRMPMAAAAGKSTDAAANPAAQGSSRLAEEFMDLIDDITHRPNRPELLR